MIILYAVPISLWPMMGKENQYFYTGHPKNNDRWLWQNILEWQKNRALWVRLYIPDDIISALPKSLICPWWENSWTRLCLYQVSSNYVHKWICKNIYKIPYFELRVTVMYKNCVLTNICIWENGVSFVLFSEKVFYTRGTLRSIGFLHWLKSQPQL